MPTTARDIRLIVETIITSHGHSISPWTWRSRHAAAPRFQSIDQCCECACV